MPTAEEAREARPTEMLKETLKHRSEQSEYAQTLRDKLLQFMT